MRFSSHNTRLADLKKNLSLLEKNGLTHPHTLSNMRLRIINLELFQDEWDGIELCLIEEMEKVKRLDDFFN